MDLTWCICKWVERSRRVWQGGGGHVILMEVRCISGMGDRHIAVDRDVDLDAVFCVFKHGCVSELQYRVSKKRENQE